MLTNARATETLQSLRKIPLVRPDNAGGRWSGIAHAELVDKIIKAVEARGWKVGTLTGHVSRQGFDLTASLPITGAVKLTSLHPSLGFARSNANRRRLTFWAGGSMVDSTAGVCFASWTAEHRNNTNTIEEEIESALDRWEIAVKRGAKEIPKAKETKIKYEEQFRLITLGHKNGFLAPARAFKVFSSVPNPCTKWQLLEAIGTVVNQYNSAEFQMDHLKGFFQIVTTGALAAPEVATT